jgi:predicted acylesterase/phospholipase RssA
MAVAAGNEALKALRALINSEPVEAETLLRQPYLPVDMVVGHDGVLCDPNTPIGGYGDESRYQFPDADDATTRVIAGPPTVLATRMGADEETMRAYLHSSLDLTMQGGTTSGVVYPLAVCELATKFRFRNVGGASAGAIAAALTAAAELGRSEQARFPETATSRAVLADAEIRRGFVGLTDVISWLTQIRPGDPSSQQYRLAQLFRPTPDSSSLFRVLIAVMRQRTWALPLLILLAISWLTRLVALAVILGTVLLAGWLGARLAGIDRAWYATLVAGAIDAASFVATLAALVLIGQGVVTFRTRIRAVREVQSDPDWLKPLRYVTSAFATPVRQWLVQLIFGLLLAGIVIEIAVRRWTYYAVGVGAGLIGSALLILVLLVGVLAQVRQFGERSYGLIAGTASKRRRNLFDLLAAAPKPVVEQSLVPWLNDSLTALAGLPTGEVLRFGHIWCGSRFRKPNVETQVSTAELLRMAEPTGTDYRLVNLELMTTDLVRQRPYRFPLQRTELDDPAQLWLDLDAFGKGDARIFPDTVLDALRQGGDPREVTDRNGQRLTVYPLPPPWDLPVVFAVRLSMALPALFQAVKMYRIVSLPPVEDDFGCRVHQDGRLLPPRPTRVAEELWFSDGGITSNFPVHFFDSPLPRWPTVSLNLGPYPDSEPMQDIWLPRDYDDVPIRATQLTPSGLSLVGAIFRTTRTWRDSMQSAMPGYRNRIAQVRNRRNEGGTNLFMPCEVIASMALRGILAGARLRTRFEDHRQWERFRWLRLRVAMGNLERLRGTIKSRRGYYADMLTGAGWIRDAEKQLTDVPTDTDVPWYVPPLEFWPAAPKLLEIFGDAYQPDGDNPLTIDVPRPEPALRQVAQE